MDDNKIFLSESEMPEAWYNINADLPAPLKPPIHPGTGEPLGPEALAPLFPMALIEQEMSMERWIDIPDEVMDVLKIWRPSPLHRAFRLEAELGTPARIYYKNESVSPPGSHKPNTAVAQVYYNKQEGVERITTETGAGQWGSALSFCCQIFDMPCEVYMVRVSYDQKPYRRLLMQTWGAECYPSPSDRTEAGRAVLAEDPDTPGSLGIAISEAVELAAKDEGTKYSLGSVLNHVLLHQTITGLEMKKQFEIAGDYPDVIVGCVGGGSNFAGFAFPYVKEKIDGEREIDIIGVEPTACPTMTRGHYHYDFGDTAEMTPLLKMHTLGHKFIPAPIHAGGLRYHGCAPQVSLLVDQGIIEPRALPQNEVFEGALMFARTEGHLPAPETSHAIRAAIDEAVKCRETGEEKCIVIGYSGHGHFDLGAYENYFSGNLTDYELPQEEIDAAEDYLCQWE
ncbi:MAG: TrpB-like pyridoxal phosphate-dependent enzyme [Armatimonadota bacterium]|jgi:tryptophan synthase beta chain